MLLCTAAIQAILWPPLATCAIVAKARTTAPLFDLARVERRTGSAADQPDLTSHMIVQIFGAANRVAPAPLIPERIRSRSIGAAQATG